MLVVLPLGLLPASLFTDLVNHLTEDPSWGRFSFCLILGGILSGLAAGAIGFLDWKNLPLGTKARRLGAAHGLTNAATMLVFLVSLALRFRDPGHPSALATALAVIALFLAGLGGWLGGELVFRLGVGVQQRDEDDSPRQVL
jgi:uncharacterized membrane protein